METTRTTFTLSEALMSAFDEARGQVSRSAALREAMRMYIELNGGEVPAETVQVGGARKKESKMNRQKAQKEINTIIEEARSRKPRHKQYPPAKHQIATLTEKGIIDLMPEKFGYLDAAMVIEAAQTEKSAVFNAMGEGEEIAASPLHQAINQENTVSVSVCDETDFSVNGLSFRFYNDALWVDGGVHDDLLLREIDCTALETTDDQAVIAITSRELEKAREYLNGIQTKAPKIYCVFGSNGAYAYVEDEDSATVIDTVAGENADKLDWLYRQMVDAEALNWDDVPASVDTSEQEIEEYVGA